MATNNIYIGEIAIKSEISCYLFKKLSEWFFKQKLDQQLKAETYIHSRQWGNKTIHVAFPLPDDSNWNYESSDDSYPSENNLCIKIDSESIEVRFYFNGNSNYQIEHPVIKVKFDYISAYHDLNLFLNHKDFIIKDKQQMNAWLQNTIIHPVTIMNNYLLTNETLPYGYDQNNKNVEEFVKKYALKHFKNRKYTTLQTYEKRPSWYY